MCDECSDEALRIFGVGSEKIKKRRILGLVSTSAKMPSRGEKGKNPPTKKVVKGQAQNGSQDQAPMSSSQIPALGRRRAPGT